uniref:Protein FAR1-RELATED SEQUENCE n=1 Tax=Kalanchoe fedtschenkoi TaxID=63787 RepID=A0A7N0VII3_KALFE
MLFSIDRDGYYTVHHHFMEHNHQFSDTRQRHLMRSQRSINDEQIELLRSFRKCGIKLSNALRFLKFQYGGSPNIDFINIDGYNALGKPDCKSFNGFDALICSDIVYAFYCCKILVDCTYKCFTQDGLLCMHSLRVLTIQCIQQIPDIYLLKRWRKDIRQDGFKIEGSFSENNLNESSFWRNHMTQKFSFLVSYSESSNE